MRAENDNDGDISEDETITVYHINASEVFDGQKIACGDYLFIAVTKDMVLPNGDVVRIAGVKPVKPDEKPSIIMDP